MPQLSITQMKTRSTDWHIAILRELAGNRNAVACLPGLDIKARSTARATLFRWGCLVNGPMQRGENMRTSYPKRFTKRGLDLLDALDPVAAVFARVRHAEDNLNDFRQMRFVLDAEPTLNVT